MPTFNVLRINEKHLAKVRAVRNRIEVEVEESVSRTAQDEFLKWYKNLSKILSNQKALTSCSVVRIYE